MSSWQPIGTAPAGVGILVTDGKLVTVGEWEYWDDGRCWLSGHGFGGYEWEYDNNPEEWTHWMPLPEPPKP